MCHRFTFNVVSRYFNALSAAACSAFFFVAPVPNAIHSTTSEALVYVVRDLIGTSTPFGYAIPTLNKSYKRKRSMVKRC